jgi:hypothetical protein
MESQQPRDTETDFWISCNHNLLPSNVIYLVYNKQFILDWSKWSQNIWKISTMSFSFKSIHVWISAPKPLFSVSNRAHGNWNISKTYITFPVILMEIVIAAVKNIRITAIHWGFIHWRFNSHPPYFIVLLVIALLI